MVAPTALFYLVLVAIGFGGAGTACVALLVLGTALLRRPLTERLAKDLLPLGRRCCCPTFSGLAGRLLTGTDLRRIGSGTGISPALGAMLVLAPEGTVLLLLAMVAGRLNRRTAEEVLAGVLGLLPPLSWRR